MKYKNILIEQMNNNPLLVLNRELKRLSELLDNFTWLIIK